MANVQDKEDNFIDLGKFKKIECKKIMGRKVCEAKFENGRFTITDDELKKICKKK